MHDLDAMRPSPFAVGTLANPRICREAGDPACLSCCANGLTRLFNDMAKQKLLRAERTCQQSVSNCNESNCNESKKVGLIKASSSNTLAAPSDLLTVQKA